MKVSTLGTIEPRYPIPPGSGITAADMSNPDPWIRARAAVFYDWNYIPWEELNDEEIRAIQSAQSNVTPRQISAGNAWSDELRQQVAQSGYQTILVSNQEYQQAVDTGQIPQVAIERMGQTTPLPANVETSGPATLPGANQVTNSVVSTGGNAVQVVTDEDIRQFVFAVLNNTALTDLQKRTQILQAMQQYGVSVHRLASATGYSLADVNAFLYPTSAPTLPPGTIPGASGGGASGPFTGSGGIGPVIGPVTGGAVAPVTGADVVMTPGTGPVLDAGFPDTNVPPSNSGSAVPLLALGLALSLLS